MEFCRSREDEARREKIAKALVSISVLMPWEKGVSEQEYKSDTLAGRIREAAGQGDEPAQSVLRDFPELKCADEVRVSLKKYSPKESSLRVAIGQGVIVICYDHKKLKVKNTGAFYFGKVENPDELFENLVRFVQVDLQKGLKA